MASAPWWNPTGCLPLSSWPSVCVPILAVPMNLILSFPKRSRDYALGCFNFVINFSASISLKQYYGNNEKCNHQYISCYVDDGSPNRSFLGGCSNEWWIKACNDKA